MTPQLDNNADVDYRGATSDGEYLPIVKVEAIYPQSAVRRGISGYCTVEYTVTTSGATRDVRPVDCSPSGLFEKESIRAAEKFKYKPRVVGGVAVETAGVQNRFRFHLEQ